MYEINGTEVTLDKAYKVLKKIADVCNKWASNEDELIGQDNDWKFISTVIETMTDAHYQGNWKGESDG